MLIKPAYETDAVWDTIRTSQPLGLWWLGSHLKERGHEVRLLDETVREGGLETRIMFQREVTNTESRDTELEVIYEEFQARKMFDFTSMAPEEFVRKYSAFHGNKIIRNMVRTGKPLEDTLAEVAKMKPDFVGIPIFASCNYSSAISLARTVKERFPATKVVMGGQHISALPRQVSENDYVDYVISGDALNAMTKLAEKGSHSSKQLDGGILKINDFPLLDMDLMDENEYPNVPNHTYDTAGRKWADYMFSKGCFRSCDFCVAGGRENRFSTTQLAKIDEQLQRFVDTGIKEVVVQDDAFLFKPERNLKEYLHLMKNHKLYWQNNGGIEFESLTPQVMQMFIDYQQSAEGRINSLYIPLNPRTSSQGKSALKDMRTRFSRNFPHIKSIRDTGVYVYTSEIIGYPGQSLESMKEDVQLHAGLVREGYVDQSMTFVTSTLPGTKLHREQRVKIVNNNDWAAYSNFVPQSKTDRVPNIRDIEKVTIKRNQQMNNVQTSHTWSSAFPNTDN